MSFKLTPAKIEPNSKCYIARVEVEILFVCNDPNDYNNKSDALDALRETLDQNYNVHDIDLDLATYLPAPWDKDCLVYGTHTGDLTAEEAMKLNEQV